MTCDLIEVPAELFIALTELSCDAIAHGPMCDKQRRIALRKVQEAGKILEDLAAD